MVIITEHYARFPAISWIMISGIILLAFVFICRAIVYGQKDKERRRVIRAIKKQEKGNRGGFKSINYVTTVIEGDGKNEEDYFLVEYNDGFFGKAPPYLVDLFNYYSRIGHYADCALRIVLYIATTCLMLYVISWLVFLGTIR